MNDPRQDPQGDLLPVGVRAYLTKADLPKVDELGDPQRPGLRLKLKPGGRAIRKRPNRMLVLDCETCTEETLEQMSGFDPAAWPPHAQALLFGNAALYTRRTNSRTWRRVKEWTFAPDDLPAPAWATLRRCFRRDNRRFGDAWEPVDGPGVRSELLPLSAWLDAFYKLAVSQRCLIVGFNLPFDFSRIAAQEPGQATGTKFRGGFSFTLWQWRNPDGVLVENRFRPRLRIKELGDRMTSMAWSSARRSASEPGRRWYPPSELLDLSQFCTAMLGQPHTLDKAARAFGLPVSKAKAHRFGVIDQAFFRYARQDVIVTAELAFAALARFDAEPISRGHRPAGPLSEHRVFSGASFGKAYLKLMGIAPRSRVQPDFPAWAQAAAMAAYTGGRTETKCWNALTPVAYLDFTSMYPTIACRLGLWKLVTARKVAAVECAEDVRSFLAAVTADDLYRPETWEKLAGFARILPNGDCLPVRARYRDNDPSWKIGNNPLHGGDQWFTLADLAASRIRGGPVPQVLDAFRLVPDRIQPDLRSVSFAGVVDVDPVEGDFFRVLVEQRARMKAGLPPYERMRPVEREAAALSLKIAVNSCAYGIFAQVNLPDLGYEETRIVSLWNSDPGDPRAHSLATTAPEENGEWFFAPLASLVTGGARLALAILQQDVESRGASYALCDTDSMLVTSSPEGGLLSMPNAGSPIRLLTPADLAEIIGRFDGLNPYDPGVIPHILENKLPGEPDLLAFSVAPKRYCLLRPDGRVVGRTESALGAIIPPGRDSEDDSDWKDAWWSAIASGSPPPFVDGPLIRRSSIQTWEWLKLFKPLNRGKPYRAQIKPWGFFLSASPDPLSTGPDASPLIAPFTNDPGKWMALPWIERSTGRPVSITLDQERAMSVNAAEAGNVVCVRTFGSYFQAYRDYKPAEFLRPQGDQPGMLQLRRVRRQSLTLIGKENNPFAELVDAGLVDDSPQEFGLQKHRWWDPLRPILTDLPARDREKLGEQVRVGDRTIRRWVDGSRRPDIRWRRQIDGACTAFAADVLDRLGMGGTTHPANIVDAYTDSAPLWRETLCANIPAAIRRDGARAVAARLGVDRETLRGWGDPNRIPIGRVLPALLPTGPNSGPTAWSFLIVETGEARP